MPEASDSATNGGNCNTLRMVTGKSFGITKIGARIMSITTVGGHEVTRNLSEPSDQTIMHIDVYANYLSAISPQTSLRAGRALLRRGCSKSVRVENRYTEAYGPHEVMLNIYGKNISTKTMITCDEDLAGQIHVGREEPIYKRCKVVKKLVILELLVNLVTQKSRVCRNVSTQFKFFECVLYCYVEERRVLG